MRSTRRDPLSHNPRAFWQPARWSAALAGMAMLALAWALNQPATTAPGLALLALGMAASSRPQEVTDGLLRQALLDLPNPVAIIDSQGHILAANHAFGELFLHQQEMRPGLRLAAPLGEPDGMHVETAWLLDTLARKGAAQGYQISLQAANGARHILEGAARRIGGQSPPRYVLVWHDVTQRESDAQGQRAQLLSLQEQFRRQTHELAQKVHDLARANAELQELDRLRADLTSLVSHQIRAPLTNMMGAIEQMQATCPAITQTCQRMFHVLQDQFERLNRLVRDVLNLTQLEAGALSLQVEPVSLMPLLRKAAEHISLRGRQVVLPYTPVLPMVMADRDRLLEILLNLLDNADRFAPPNTPLEIDVRATQTEVVVSVLDRGPGLQPDDLERIFEKFYRAEHGDAQAGYGYGLGLYICRKLLEAMQGRIWAANRPQGGAAFHFSLPVSP